MFDLTCIYRLVYERISLVCNLVKLGMCSISMYSGVRFIADMVNFYSLVKMFNNHTNDLLHIAGQSNAFVGLIL